MINLILEPYLSKHVADELFRELGVSLDELKKIQPLAMFLHYHLKVMSVLVGLQQLWMCVCMHVCMYVCVCVYACVYVCMYVCVYVCVYRVCM